MCLQPRVVTLFHLLNVMRNVAFLDRIPAGKAQEPVGRMIHAVFPNRFGQRDEQLIRSPTKSTNYFECLMRALMKIAKSAGPACGIKFEGRAFRLCDKTAATDVGAGFAVVKMQ